MPPVRAGGMDKSQRPPQKSAFTWAEWNWGERKQTHYAGIFCQNPRVIPLGAACPQHVRLRLVGGKADHTHKIVLAGIFGRVTVT